MTKVTPLLRDFILDRNRRKVERIPPTRLRQKLGAARVPVKVAGD
jgi:hypothetical protein